MISKRDVLTGGSALLGTMVYARAAQAAAKPMIVPVPITFYGGQPVLSLTIGGQGPYHFILDTGSDLPAIKEPLAKQLGLHMAGSIKMESLKGDESSYLYQAETLVIGGRLPLPRMTFVGMANFKETGVDGLLPASFLTFLPSQLDFEAKEIRYYIGGAEMDLTGFDKVPAFFEAEREGQAEKVYVEVNFDGRKLVCCLDTGAPANLFVYSGVVDRFKLWDKYPIVRDIKVAGVNGQGMQTRLVQGVNLSFGTLKIPSMPVTLGDPKEYEQMSDTHDGLVGTPFMRHFIVAFGADKSLYFKPNSSFPALTNQVPDSLIADAPAGTLEAPAVPFLYGDDRRIVIPGRVGDGPAFTCLLNTGVVASGVGAKRAADLGLPTLPTGDVDGSNITFSSVRLPKLKFKSVTANPNINPELGLDFLTLLPTALDFDQNLLTFFIKATPDLTGYVKLPAERKSGNGRFLVKTTLAGHDLSCLIDTLVPLAILVPPATTKALNLWDAVPNPVERPLGAGAAAVKTRLVGMKGFDMGSFHIDMAPVTLIDPTATGPAYGGVDAVLGMGILHRLNLVFAGDGSVWAKPNSFWADTKAN
jgi:hypothetical protein